MRNIKGWTWNSESRLYVHDAFVKSIDAQLGTDKHGDVKQKEMYRPDKARLFNTFEQGQQIRFLVILNWIKFHFQDLEKKEKKKRRKLILDLGCSRSFIYRFWKNRMNYYNWPIINYWGVDSNDKRIQEGRSMFVKKKNDRVVYFLADLGKKIKFPAKADVIVCAEVLEHIPVKDSNTLINTIHTSLSPGGIAIISSPNPKEKGDWVWEDSPQSHHYEYTWIEAKELLESHGFEVLDQTGVLPDRNFRYETSYKEIRDRLSRYIPSPIVNNLLVLIEDDHSLSQQWIYKVKKIK